MSSRYRVEFELVGNSGNINAVLNRLNNGISQVGKSSRGASNEMGLWQRQMMAMSTTARYALAGGVVFGVTSAIRALSQFQVALGNIETVATRPGGIAGLGNQVGEMGRALIRISNETITPVNDLADAVTNLYSSLSQDLPVRDVEKLTSILSMTARSTQVKDVRALTGSILGGVNAFGLPTGPGQIDKSVQLLSDQFYKVIQRSINISGEEFAQQAGRLYSSARSGGLTPAQTGGLVVQASQFGGTASSIIQNLSQLLIYLRNPKTPAQRAAYAAAGISDADLISNAPGAGFSILQRLISHAQTLGIGATVGGRKVGAGQIRGMSDEDAQNLRLSGQGARFFAQAFGRIQSQRTLIALASESLPDLNKQVKDVANSAGAVQQAFQRFRDQAPLAYLAQTLSNLSLSSVANLQPVLNPIARGVGYVANQADLHPHVTGAIEGALGLALAGNALRRYLPGRLGNLLRRRNIGTGDVASTALTAESSANVLAGGPTDGTRANPYWVIIHPTSWVVGSPGGFGAPVNPTSPTNLARRGIPKLPLAPWMAPAAAAATGAALFGYGIYRFTNGVMNRGGPTPLSDAFMRHATVDPSSPFAQQHPALRALYQQYIGGGLTRNQLEARLAGNPTALGYANWRTIQGRDERVAAMRAAGFVRSQTGAEAGAFAVDGNLSGEFTVHLVDKQGREIGVEEKKGVPVKLWGAKAVPQHRGKPRDTRKGR